MSSRAFSSKANACMCCPPVPFSPALKLQEPGVYQVCDDACDASDDETKADDVDHEDGDGGLLQPCSESQIPRRSLNDEFLLHLYHTPIVPTS